MTEIKTSWKYQLKVQEDPKRLQFHKTMTDKSIKSLLSNRLCKRRYKFYPFQSKYSLYHINIFGCFSR